MPENTRLRTSLLIGFVVFALLLVGQGTLAQEQLPQLAITGSDPTSPPSVALHVVGRDAQGAPLDFATQDLTVTHNGAPVTPVVDGAHRAGTLTVFLVDLPTGVSAEIPAVQDAIKQFASPAGGMMEQVDAVAVYQVAETESREILAPTIFYNAVQNLFVDDLTPETGATALYDSVGNMLENIDNLKPNSDMVASIVVMSDGTDALSSQYQVQDVVLLAGSKGVPVHTVSLDNVDLPPASQEEGRTNLNNLSTGSRGIATAITDTAGLPTIYERIASFRDQTRLRYVVEDLAPGAATIELSLTNEPVVRDETSVTIPANFPSVQLNVPPESRAISLPTLDEPVTLRLSADVSWLDGEERSITAASFLVNGSPIAEIPPDQLDSFDVEISTFQYGSNDMAVAVADEQGLTASSPPIPMQVTEGDLSVPDDISAGGGFGSFLRTLLIILLVLGVLALGAFLLLRSGILTRGSRRGQRPAAKPAPTTAVPPTTPAAAEPAVYPADEGSGPIVMAHLEVLDATSQMPSKINLEGTMIKLGRSPVQANIAFREDITVSRLHATLMLEGTHYRIFDENSTSGTWVNERQVPDYGLELNDGDEIHLGAVHLRFRQL